MGALRGRAPVQLAALLAGSVLVLAGIFGFVPGLTTRYGGLGFAGEDSRAKLLGAFQVSVLHNVVHAALGAAILLGSTPTRARSVLTAGGVALLTLWLAGVVGVLDWLPANPADNWLHLLLGLALLALGRFA